MHSFIVNLNTLTASLFLCVFFIILGSVSIKKNKKIIIQLILISTLLIMKVSYILKRMDMEILIGQEYELFYIFITVDIVILIIFYYLSQKDKMNLKDNVLILDYLVCIFSFYLSYKSILKELNTFVIINLIIFNIYYFYKKYNKVIQGISLLYLINFIIIVQTSRSNILIYNNTLMDLMFSITIFYKVYTIYINQFYVKYVRLENNLNRSSINMKFYEEKLNNNKVINKILKEDLYLKERNLHILLGQFKKSALLIDYDNYIINSNDIVFKTMFNKYMNDNKPIKLDDFLQNNMDEKENFLKCVSQARDYNESITMQIRGKDGRIFECIFSLYEEYESYSIICILSDITYEKKISLKIQENDIKYKKIVENIPYSIILAKNKEILYNNNKLELELNDLTIKNIILNEATKGEINYTDNSNKEISLYVDRLKFYENKEELSLIEIKDISKYKKLLNKLDESANQYKTLIDTIPEAICVLDYESKEFEYANNTFFDLFKIQDIENMDFDEIYNDIAISSGNINENIKYIRKTLKDGYGGLINIESSVVLIDINKETKMVLIIRDITKEIKVESMKKEIEESEAIIKDRDDFFINMSHELLTPANLLHTSNQFIAHICKGVINRESSGEFANCISVMKRQVDILITLINKIMELSKLEGNYYKNNKGIYNIVSLCEDIIAQLNKYTKYKNINIVFDTEVEEAYVKINPDDMAKAVLTLLSCVVKYSKIKSTINFTVKVKKNKVILSIENFKRYDYEQYFEKYEEKILNLSMSIAKLIVNMHKGKIDLKTNQEDCVLIEIELNMENNIYDEEKNNKTIDENFVYNEYKNICNL